MRNQQAVNAAADRFIRTVVFTSDEQLDLRTRLMGLMWRPGDNTGHFLDKALRPAGAAVAITLRYEYDGATGDTRSQRRMPLTGFKARPREDGSLEMENVFCYDAKRKPVKGARGRVVDPERNPTLLDAAAFIHRTVGKKADNTHRLPIVPTMPKVFLGFNPQKLPAFEETPALLQLVAARLGLPVGRLHTKDPVLLQRQFEDTWAELVIMPGHGLNTSDLALIDATYCTQGRQALRVFEYFGDMLGVTTWNPARDVLAHTRPNPAGRILKSRGVEFNGETSLETCEVLIADMRRALGGGNELFNDHDICDALMTPREKLSADVNTPDEAIERIGQANVLRAMRDLLQPVLCEGTTDEDLLKAARDPDGPLVCSGICQVQVVYLQCLPRDQALNFTPEQLGCRITANFYRPWVREEMQAKVQEPLYVEPAPEPIVESTPELVIVDESVGEPTVEAVPVA